MQNKNYNVRLKVCVYKEIRSCIKFLQGCRSPFGPIVISPVAETIVKGIVSRDEYFFKAYSNIKVLFVHAMIGFTIF
jgi:hypothetical protein